MSSSMIYQMTEICKTLKKFGINAKKIHRDGTVDVDENIDLINKGLSELPLKFGQVNGNFLCCDNELTSLKGAPQYVSGIFSCARNKITSLEGCPKEIGEDFICCVNELTSLANAPTSVGGDFNCSDNEISDLSNIPTQHIGGKFYGLKNKITDTSALTNIAIEGAVTK